MSKMTYEEKKAHAEKLAFEFAAAKHTLKGEDLARTKHITIMAVREATEAAHKRAREYSEEALSLARMMATLAL